MIYLSDVDVVRKLAACGFLPLLPALLPENRDEIDIRYLPSLRHRLERAKHRLHNTAFQEHLEKFCQLNAEVSIASDLERLDKLLQGGMDSGEAILFAEAESTGGIVVTGDKRAILLYRKLSTAKQRKKISVICLEQLLLRIHSCHGFEHLRQGCCQGLSHDKMLKLVFSSGEATQETDAIEGIESFLGALARGCEDLLFSFD